MQTWKTHTKSVVLIQKAESTDTSYMETFWELYRQIWNSPCKTDHFYPLELICSESARTKDLKRKQGISADGAFCQLPHSETPQAAAGTTLVIRHNLPMKAPQIQQPSIQTGHRKQVLTFFPMPVQVEDGNSGLVLRSNHDLLKHHQRCWSMEMEKAPSRHRGALHDLGAGTLWSWFMYW